ncbi:hypothetical protein BSS2_I0328 [Brucella suis bv. 1 str. S2]|uniref:Uncharacterized protein n=2 Tax=Brucella TaxID=234 RepID=Q57F27_BRUAB|nr:hypothetical protein BR0332 [Brucella suis 1330]AAX73757.1 hypothetical protein BruAb1_0358 [Brucella abortus bv. 1 str. 9-941]ADZ86304.1 conserved hypothetical protein [Brucella melitensis M5-90]AEU05362.1 hypothetical protein BSVBI22_A0333 [Brucella suis VBI22]AHN45990.1 hypothetical protein BSS2_I0328 [Brucella suis bv. 1 str. S2]CDL75747.1 unnamed protein product [Brucella canis str. Oliveri]
MELCILPRQAALIAINCGLYAAFRMASANS